jgi:transposase InsO family protein
MFPLHSKSDAYIAFVKFKCFAENQFSTKIKNFQFDGGGEFTSHQFKKFLETNGIMHRISCPYTSQQNGIAERKHRHLVETGLALLAQSHLSNTYWVEAFNTAIYLINRLLTTVLNDQ